MPSAIVEINGDMGEEEAEALVKDAQARWTGKNNNSKMGLCHKWRIKMQKADDLSAVDNAILCIATFGD